MSQSQVRGDQSTSSEVSVLAALNALGIATTHQAIQKTGSASFAYVTTGDASGPSSALDNAIARFDGTTGKLIQTSLASIDDVGLMSATGLALTGNMSLIYTNSGGINEIYVRNGSNTAGSDSDVLIEVAGASSGDPYVHFSIDTLTDWTIGPDNSDSDKLKIDIGSTPGSSTALAIDVAKNVYLSVLAPFADSATALQIKDSTVTNVIFNVDSTNSRIGINATAPSGALHVSGAAGADIHMFIGSTGSSKSVFDIHYDTTNNVGYLEAYTSGVAARDIYIRGSTIYLDGNQDFNIELAVGNATLTVGEGTNFVLGTTTGTKIGTSTTQKLAFFNSTPIVKPTVTGSKGANAALTSLLTQLANLGLVVDSST